MTYLQDVTAMPRKLIVIFLLEEIIESWYLTKLSLIRF